MPSRRRSIGASAVLPLRSSRRIYGGLYAFADLTGRPKILARYKVQPFQRVTASQYKQICAIVLRNQLLVSLPVTVFLSGPVARWRGMSSSSHDLPGFGRTLGTWCFALLCEEVGFYCASVVVGSD